MKKFIVKLTRAMVVSGEVIKAGSRVELDEATAKDFLRRGRAELIAAPADDAQDDTPEQVELSRLNKTQLVDVAQQLGLVSVSDTMTKAEIIAAIEAAGADEGE